MVLIFAFIKIITDEKYRINLILNNLFQHKEN